MGVQIQGDTGNVIATKGTYSGNVTIGGTLTYEDVTNIDAVGVITARSGIDAASNLLLKTGGSEKVRINASGKVLIGHTSARGIGGSQFRQLQIEGTSAGPSSASLVRNSADPSPPSLNLGKSRASSVGGTTIVQVDDALGTITFAGADGTNLQTNAAEIRGEVDGTPGENDMPGRLVFKTTSDGSASSSERLRITSEGKIGIGTTNPQYALDISDGASSGIRIGVATHAYRMRANVSSANDFGFFIEDEEGNDLYNVRGPHATSKPNIHVFSTAGAERLSITGVGLTVTGSILANGSFYQEDAQTSGDDAQDKTIHLAGRGVFLMLISYSLGTTTTEVSRNVYSLGLFTSRSNGATWTSIQQDLTSSHVGNLTISDANASGKLRVQKSGGSDARTCAFRIDVLSSANVQITVTDT